MGSVLHFDGLCEPKNPAGVATWGWVCMENGQVRRDHGLAAEPWSNGATNNVAEYTALLRGLSSIDPARVPELEVRGDSQLVVRQLNGTYAVHSPRLAPLHCAVRDALRRFRRVDIQWIPREQNKEADAEAWAAYVAYWVGKGKTPPRRRF